MNDERSPRLVVGGMSSLEAARQLREKAALDALQAVREVYIPAVCLHSLRWQALLLAGSKPLMVKLRVSGIERVADVADTDIISRAIHGGEKYVARTQPPKLAAVQAGKPVSRRRGRVRSMEACLGPAILRFCDRSWQPLVLYSVVL